MKSGTARSGQRRFYSIKKGQVLFLCKEERVSVFFCVNKVIVYHGSIEWLILML